MQQDDEKKKIMILAVLGVVIVGVGAFQLMPQDAPAPAPKASGWKPPVAAEEKAETTVRNPSLVAALARRDPFDVPDFAKEKDPNANEPVPGTNVPIKEAPLPAARFDDPKPVRPPRRLRGRLARRIPASGFGPEDVDPLPETNLTVEPVRPPTGNGSNPPTNVEPPKPPEPTFDYALNGVILGRRPAAVLRDKQGNQRLVTAGGMIDGEATLVEVRPGAAIVDVRGKRMRIEVKGETDAK